MISSFLQSDEIWLGLSFELDLVPTLNSKNRPDETQDHLEMCPGMEFERRGLCMHNRRDLVKFWRRATVKLAKMAVKGPKAKK